MVSGRCGCIRSPAAPTAGTGREDGARGAGAAGESRASHPDGARSAGTRLALPDGRLRGDGLGGSSIQYGRGKLTDREMLRAARSVMEHSRLAVLMLPGVGVKGDLEMAHAEGARLARIATHSTD